MISKILFALSFIITIVHGHLLIESNNPNDFRWSDCGGQIIRFNKLDFEPKPLVLSETKELYLTGDISINEDLPLDAEMTIVVNKTLNYDNDPYNITLPCIDGTFGSCTLKVCDSFKTWYNDLFCPFFQNIGRPCSCPIQAGRVTLNHGRVTVPFEQFKGFLAQMASVSFVLFCDQKKTSNFFFQLG